MPYVKPKVRDQLDAGAHPINPGELNYCVTKMLNRYVREQGLSYGIINEVMGVMGSAAAEFYRRVAAPYEETKIIENGDVYDQHRS